MEKQEDCKVPTGSIYSTCGVNELMDKNDEYRGKVLQCLFKYMQGDWGDLCEEDKLENERALKEGDRLLGRYNIEPKPIYIITEWDRRNTTILFPEEY